MQNWQLELTKKCSELNMEAVASLSGITIVCPKLPGRKDKAQIMALIPEDARVHVNFEEGPKPSSLSHFKNVILGMGIAGSLNATPDAKTKHIKVIISGNGNTSSEYADWSKISEVFERDGYFNSWDVTFDGITVLTYNRAIAKVLQGNQVRDKVIQKDDITNLHILLETEQDWDKLLEKL